MKTVIRYQAVDGSVFDSQEQAASRDTLVAECILAEAIIGPRPKLHSEEFVQHDPATAQRFAKALVALARKHTAWWDGWAKVGEDDFVHPGSIVGRILDDSGLTPLNRVWYRYHSMDHLWREWDQPFFANKARAQGDPHP